MLHLKRFEENNKNELVKVMTRAFDEDSRIHLNTIGGPPGYNNGEFIDKWFKHQYATSYTVFNDDRIIGGVVLWIHQNQHNSLGCLFLDPDFENQGIGTRLWQKIESMYPDTISWTTETPIFSHRNHNFYINKCGFKCIRIENPQDYNEGQFILEKIMEQQ